MTDSRKPKTANANASAVPRSLARLVSTPGYDALWLWFGLSRASWLTLPRVLLHEMPDEWQGKMAALLGELDSAFPNYPDIHHSVTAKSGGKYIKMPDALCNYRNPDHAAINAMRANHQDQAQRRAINNHRKAE